MKRHAFKSRSLGHLLLIVLMGLLFTLSGPGAVLADGTFTVNSSGDGNTSDAFLTLREAIALANGGTGGGDGLGRILTNGEKAQISGGCTFTGNNGGDPTNLNIGDWMITGGCGAGIFDNIRFDPSIAQINLAGGVLPITDNGTWIDGQNGVPRIDASGLLYDTFVITGSYVTISNLSLINGQPTGLHADITINPSPVGTRIAYNYIGTVLGATNCTPSGVTRNGWSGIRVNGNHSGGSGDNGLAAYIYGNVIGCHPGHAIYIDHSDYVAVGVQPPAGTIADGNWLGVSRTGEALPNAYYGAFLHGAGAPFTAAHNTIANNVISGNFGSGIVVRGANDNTIRANKIGTNPAGSAALPNGGDGIDVHESGSHHNTIGGIVIGDRNVISGNTWSGVRIRDGAHTNELDFNLIGLSAAGTVAIPNGEAGVAVFNANDNTIGSSVAGVSQFLSGNTREGIYLENSSGTFIGPVNSIGVAVDGTTPRGNGLQGIMINGASDTYVATVRVAYNRGAGIAVVGNTATGNHISFRINRNNGGLPLDLGNDGFTPNGSRIPPGPNNWINYPVLTSAVGNVFTGTACAGCQVWIYQAEGNPATPGGGGSRLTQTVANEVGIWSATLPADLTGRDVSLQACDSTENTSEMSPRPQLYLPAVLR